jgi:ferredoxin-type protein NapH
VSRTILQRRRAWTQAGFFALFLLAPVLDIFRIDLTQGHAILFGQDWTLGIDAFLAGQAGIGEAAFNLFWRGFLPIFGGGALFLWIAWRYGRLYCGWLCPHFSVVELINGLMRRASGKPSLWERRPLPPTLPDGHRLVPEPLYWLPTFAAVLGFAFLWALVLLTYLLPPVDVYHNLFTGTLTRNQAIFLTAGTLALTVEFLLARHLFCRFACAVGLFQSLAWMANDKAMVVGFDTARAGGCHSCNNACDNACPMRLKPRTLKRKMFTCTECAQCISACVQVQERAAGGSLLRWVDGRCALPVVTGRTRDRDNRCFQEDSRMVQAAARAPAGPAAGLRRARGEG